MQQLDPAAVLVHNAHIWGDVLLTLPPSPGLHLETKAGSLAKHRASGHVELFLG